jgi:Type III restriction enzyme, res subunit
MQLGQHLVLTSWLLKSFGFERFEQLRDEFSTRQHGYDSLGRSYFANALLGKAGMAVGEHQLFDFDAYIREAEDRLRSRRGQSDLSLKYYQYFALLFTEYYLWQLVHDADGLLTSLEQHRASEDRFKDIAVFQEQDLKKLAYWMATGSGKTLLMHINLWQMQRYFAKGFDNIMLITPNEGLSRQHLEDMRLSGIKCKHYGGNESDLKCPDGEVLILEITKLTAEKRGKGEGVSIDVAWFEGTRNLILIDEGHKGQKSEEQKWKKLREALAAEAGSFIFEYSATFGQIITGKKDNLLDEYGKSIVFDYSYRHFYADGYGKDFTVYNIVQGKSEEYTSDQVRLLMVASLLGYYEQLALYEAQSDEMRKYLIEKPLWVFVGSRVIGSGSALTAGDKQSVSDVVQILQFFSEVLAYPEALQTDMQTILGGTAGLMKDGRDIFGARFQYLRNETISAETVLRKVFHGVGTLEAFEIKQAEGEIGLRAHTSDQYFAVINIGDVSRFGKTLEADSKGVITLQDDQQHKSLFQALDHPTSPIQILIGSKKFIEGWNSWRVSSMGLMNMGKGEGAQIIQLFGRGVRLKGQGYSLKREPESALYGIRALQTISIFGLNASYMNSFLANINKETPEYEERSIDINWNHAENWENKLLVPIRSVDDGFKQQAIWLHYLPNIGKRINADLRSKVTVASGGFNSGVAEDAGDYDGVLLLSKYLPFLDFAILGEKLHDYRILRGYAQLLFTPEVLRDIIVQGSTDFQIKCFPGQFGIDAALNGTIQRITEFILKDYIQKYVADTEKAWLTQHLEPSTLNSEQQDTFFPKDRKMVIKFPKERLAEVEKWINNLKDFYEKDVDQLPSVHFDKHLYSPLAVWKKGNAYNEIKTDPVKLNEGETLFLAKLKTFVTRGHGGILDGCEVFVLRNLSQRGIGFFMQSSSFFPDFIIWVVKGNEQRLYFIDPKGLLNVNHFADEKIVFCCETIQEISTALQDRLNPNNGDKRIVLSAHIVSVTPFGEVSKRWGGVHKDEFIKHHVHFMPKTDDFDFLREIFG